MGGGDLNLKKSWHPSTLRNIERVWKAEQKHEVEKQKIEQLQKELAEERAREEIQAFAEDQGVVKKREERLDWMYQGPAAMTNREDYLLGRKIDKTLELIEQEETGATSKKNDDFDVGATMFSSQDLSGTATVDLANKIREDPLFSIMKKEKEQRKNLLSNPVKMKQLQQMLQKSLGKEKKKRRSSEDSYERKPHKHKSKHSRKDEERVSKKYQDDHAKKRKYFDREDAPSPRRDRHHEKSNIDSQRRRHFSPRRDGSRSRVNERQERRSTTLDDEERERRLKQMQQDAEWREEQRKRKVRRYREDDRRDEEEINSSARVDASDFVKPMLSKAAGKGSLENRVKQKIFSIQRSSSDMDRNFARR